MDKEKAKLIFDKMEEIREIVKTELNNDYFSAVIYGDYMNFMNDPDLPFHYSFSTINGEIFERNYADKNKQD